MKFSALCHLNLQRPNVTLFFLPFFSGKTNHAERQSKLQWRVVFFWLYSSLVDTCNAPSVYDATILTFVPNKKACQSWSIKLLVPFHFPLSVTSYVSDGSIICANTRDNTPDPKFLIPDKCRALNASNKIMQNFCDEKKKKTFCTSSRVFFFTSCL